MAFMSFAEVFFFQNQLFKKFFQEHYVSVNLVGSRSRQSDVVSDLTWHVCSKLFAKVTIRLHIFRKTIRGSTPGPRADPESFVRGGPNLIMLFFLFVFFFFFFSFFFFLERG